MHRLDRGPVPLLLGGLDLGKAGAAPLARSDSGAPARSVDRLLESLGRVMEPYYGFRSLHAFKAKFQPRHVPLYLAFRDEADLPRVGLALSRAYLPDVRLRQLAKLVSSSRAR